ncbi:MAG: NAD(P)H-binding protein [Polyangiales bacterium]
MNVIVFGATGGSGRAAVQHLLAMGHEVSAFTRRTDVVLPAGTRLIQGDVMNAPAVEAAVAGHDAVIVTLGITENPLRVRFFGPAHTPLDVRSTGTRHIIAAMRVHGIRKLVVQTTYGVGDTRDKLGFADRLFFSLVLKPQILDSEVQNADVIASGLDWVLIQPVHLTDHAAAELPFSSTSGEIVKLQVSRNSVGRFIAQAVQRPELVGKSVSVSGPAAV